MSGTWRIGTALALAQLQAAITTADAGPGPSKVQLFATARHATADGAMGDAPQAEVLLAVPCATIVGGALVLHVADEGGALVTEGRVTDDANGGDFQVTGGTTPPGETSPLLQAGGLVLLGTTSLT